MYTNPTRSAAIAAALLVLAGCTAAVQPTASGISAPPSATPARSPAIISTPAAPNSPRPTNSASASASAFPTASVLPQATGLVSPSAVALVTRTSAAFKPAFRFEAPSSWVTVDEQDDGYVISAEAAGVIGLQTNPIIATNANDCEGLGAPGGATTAKGIIAALRNDPRLATTPAEPVTVGGFEGQSIDIGLAPTWTGTCHWSGGKPAALLLTTQVAPGPFFGLVDSERIRLTMLRVGKDVVSVAVDSGLVSEAESVLRSLEFTP